MTGIAHHLLRTACQTMAEHGDNAIQYAKARASALRDNPTASSQWESVSHVISVIFEEEFCPAD